MRRTALVVPAAFGALILAAAPAMAEPEVRQFAAYCTPSDPELAELSGLAEVDGVLYAVGDSGTDHRVAVLDASCTVDRWIDVPVDPYDVEDLGSYGGDLWLSDTGDNRRTRETVALTRMDPSTGAGELHRLVYPDGPHDAETLLISSDGRPVVVTKEPSGVSGIYVPEGDTRVDELASPGPTSLKKVGEVAFARTTTPGGPPFITGSVLATGGAVSSDGSVAAVRTYTDVYLFPVVDGDVAAALTAEPVVIAAPARPQGEAVAFTADGALLLASESAGGPLPPIDQLAGAVFSVQPQQQPATESTGAPSSPGGRWSFGAIAVAGVLAVVSVVYAFGLAGRRS
ncbi:MAG: hypothetical protein WBQ44_03520 [Rhodococcus sp. (in: high G+C Gram-positive bacteria)]